MKKKFMFLCVLLVTALLVVSPITGVLAQQDSDNDGISDAKENELAAKFKPVLHFASGEKFFPTDPNYHIQNSELYMKSGETNILVDNSPTIASIAQYTTESYFLNNTLGSYEAIAQNYEQNREIYGDKIYARVTSDAQYIVVQYWFFYAYNPGSLNQHQGDWEMIQIVLDSSETPLYAVYSQHHSGQIAQWRDVEKVDGTHPRVYVALGSHANYFRYYQGKLGLESDTVGNDYTLNPEDLETILLGEMGTGNHPASQNWLAFGGRWGDWTELADAYMGFAGPNGPGHGENTDKWFNPVSWGNETFQVDQTWFTASMFAYYFLYIFAIILVIRVGFKAWKIIKNKKNGKLGILKMIRSKASIFVILGLAGVIVYLVALFLPWYTCTGNIQTTMLSTEGTVEIVTLDGVNGLRVNMLQGNQGLTPLFGIAIPFSIIFLSSVLLNALDIIAAEKPSSLSKSYIISGITSLIPAILILGAVISLTVLIESVAGAFSGGLVLPPQVADIVSAISSSPFGGNITQAIDSNGTASISWGLGIGAYMFIVAATIKIVAGIMLRNTKVNETD
ncbi:MAG: Vps62-related protein [Candidatus Bathyarchaeota archaeon]|nr:Vps62-related protein [Candidatus Bathyarchaeum tardum]WGM90293.1 MAG: Vps62-related protein [Candidatus Bathyarchaeum tardum]